VKVEKQRPILKLVVLTHNTAIHAEKKSLTLVSRKSLKIGENRQK
jgi:hypothetical protein